MKKLLLQILKPLVDAPGEIRITEISGSKTTIYELRCRKDDVGKVIGKSGKTVTALRAILSAVAAREGRRAVLEVAE